VHRAPDVVLAARYAPQPHLGDSAAEELRRLIIADAQPRAAAGRAVGAACIIQCAIEVVAARITDAVPYDGDVCPNRRGNYVATVLPKRAAAREITDAVGAQAQPVAARQVIFAGDGIAAGIGAAAPDPGFKRQGRLWGQRHVVGDLDVVAASVQ